jgi:hypothetical protein
VKRVFHESDESFMSHTSHLLVKGVVYKLQVRHESDQLSTSHLWATQVIYKSCTSETSGPQVRWVIYLRVICEPGLVIYKSCTSETSGPRVRQVIYEFSMNPTCHLLVKRVIHVTHESDESPTSHLWVLYMSDTSHLLVKQVVHESDKSSTSHLWAKRVIY